MSCLYFTGPWYSPYVYLSGDYDVVPNSAKAVSVAPGVFACIVTIAIELSLVLQLKVVCVTLKPSQRLLITLGSMLVALIAIGFRIAQVTITSKCVLEAETCKEYLWLFKAQPITTTISICFFSFCFCGKLGWSLSQRRKMGLTQFGPMQIIFIGGFQTLFVPGKFFFFPLSLLLHLAPLLYQRDADSPSSSSCSPLRHHPIHNANQRNQIEHPHRHRNLAAPVLALGLEIHFQPLGRRPRSRRPPQIPRRQHGWKRQQEQEHRHGVRGKTKAICGCCCWFEQVCCCCCCWRKGQDWHFEFGGQ